jgi:hypothetical protein
MPGNDELRRVYMQTQIVRKPTHGIISGYHHVPYVCLGEAAESDGTTRVAGKIHVSPRLVLRPSHLEPSYGEIFGEDNVDREIAARMFGFLGFRGRPVECESEDLTVSHEPGDTDRALNETLDKLERMEDIATGVILTPDSRYFPVSVERFISSILEDEFSV